MAQFLWSGGFEGSVNDPANWTDLDTGTSPAGPPGPTDDALFVGGLGDELVLVPAGETFTDNLNLVFDLGAPNTPAFDIAGTWTTVGFEFLNPVPVDVSEGGLLDVTGGLDAAAPEAINIFGLGAGGTVELANATIGAAGSDISFNFDNDPIPGSVNAGVLQFGTVTGTTTTQTITDVADGDKFVIGGHTFTGDTVDYSGTTLTVMNGATTVFTMDNVSAAAGTTFHIVDTDIIQAVCYARGTMIRTPEGELPVEKLRAGKRVITLVDGQEVPQTVTWLGHRRISLADHPRPETVAPIRILRDAVADGMPHRDLVVSPDHAIFVEGTLICARQLVNGTTIRQERDWTAVDYYHVELEQHAILLAEGLPAESYIDTGNSGFFANSGQPMVLHPDLTDETGYPTREAGSCAPFVWDEASVRPVWQRLAERAALIGRPVPQRATTTDPGLRLRTKLTGRRTIEPIYSDGNLVIFVLPSRSRGVRLLSRAQSPTDARPWLEDRRHLGVRVKRIVLRSADELREIPVDHPDLTRGWWAVERDGQAMSRWTDGEAVLPLPAMSGTVMLEIHLAGSMTYVVDAVSERETGRCAAA